MPDYDIAPLTTECALFGEGATFHHVGLAVHSIEELSPDSRPMVDEVQGVWMAFLNVHGVTIELLEPYGDNSPIERSLRKGQKLLHLCYQVPDLDDALAAARESGLFRIRPVVRTPVYDDRRVTWVYSRNLGLFELIECG